MLIIGMGTEAVIFFLSAFDDKQTGGNYGITESRNCGITDSQNSSVDPSVDPLILRSVDSTQITQDIDELRSEIERMNENVKKLNAAYERMLKAMKDE